MTLSEDGKVYEFFNGGGKKAWYSVRDLLSLTFSNQFILNQTISVHHANTFILGENLWRAAQTVRWTLIHDKLEANGKQSHPLFSFTVMLHKDIKYIMFPYTCVGELNAKQITLK